jgi:hypothetical protein
MSAPRMTSAPIPIGLTRAEEAAMEGQPEGPRIIVKAPPGSIVCRMVIPPNGDDCVAAATCRIVWPGEDRPTPACVDCARRIVQLAQSHRSSVRIVSLEPSQ